MQRATILVTMLISGIITSAWAQEQKNVAGPDPATIGAPEHKVGDTRVFDTVDPLSRAKSSESSARIAAIEGGQIKTEVKSSSGSTGLVITDVDGHLIADTQRPYNPPKPIYSFPLEIGKKWEYSTSFPYAGCGTSRIDMKAEVIGWETVTVPAGTYRALRVNHSGYWNNCYGSDFHRETYWYVPSLRGAVRADTQWGTRGGTGGYGYELRSVELK